MADFIPVSEPLIGKKEEEYVLDCIRTGWISSEGKYIGQFERACAEYCSVSDGIAVSSGTAALQVAVECLDLPQGSEVIMPTFTIISCATAILEAGLVPVLVDCDPETWTMDVSQIESKITPKTKAIMFVHMYGHAVDMDPVFALAEKFNLLTIEDAAEAHGAEYKGRKCGGLADISIFSFYANKLVSTGEGGMVLTNNKDYAERARSLRNLCFLLEKRFYHKAIGHNYRMSNVQAAIGVGQCENLEAFVHRKREMADLYTEGLQSLPLQLPIEKEWAKNIYWMYAVVLDDSVPVEAVEISRLLLLKGVQSRPFFIGMHEQPIYQEQGYFQEESYPVSERIARRGFYLPSGQAITDAQIKQVIEAMQEILTHF